MKIVLNVLSWYQGNLSVPINLNDSLAGHGTGLATFLWHTSGAELNSTKLDNITGAAMHRITPAIRGLFQ